jgi:hypothetical protein
LIEEDLEHWTVFDREKKKIEERRAVEREEGGYKLFVTCAFLFWGLNFLCARWLQPSDPRIARLKVTLAVIGVPQFAR